MHFIIFDLEATCWERATEAQQKKQEIIEIGAVKLDENGDYISSFAEFIRPVFHPTLSDFCQRLTSISQVDVNRARYFADVAEDFRLWVEEDEHGEVGEYLFCSWGFFDQRILSKNCLLHDMDDAWTEPHISLKHQYPRIRGLGRSIGLRRAVEQEGFDFEGTHHRGIDDAQNLAKVFAKYLHQWAY